MFEFIVFLYSILLLLYLYYISLLVYTCELPRYGFVHLIAIAILIISIVIDCGFSNEK